MAADSSLDVGAAAVPATRVKSSASTASQLGFPLGHLNHLSAGQEDALERFKTALEQANLWKRTPKPSHDDQTLLRYLRARRWIVDDAMVQFRDTEEWRAANNIDVLYQTIEHESYEQSRRLYPQWTGRRDRRGIPLYVFEVKTLDSKTVATYERLGAANTFSQAKTDGNTPPGLLRLFALYENLTRFSHPLCTNLQDREHSDVPVTMTTNIVDISGVGLKQFWNLKNHMQAASQLATAHYPETLDRIFIIGAPGFFNTVWGWIKRWFDPITVSKIFVLSAAEVKPTLEAFIDPKNIPKRYGGDLDFEFGQLSVLDPMWEGVVRWENGHKGFPSGPLIWEDEKSENGEDRLVCVLLGGVKGELQRERICTIPKTWNPEVEAEDDAVIDSTGVAQSATTTTTQDETASPTTTAADVDVDADVASQVVEKLKISDDTNEKTPNMITTAPPATATVA